MSYNDIRFSGCDNPDENLCKDCGIKLVECDRCDCCSACCDCHEMQEPEEYGYEERYQDEHDAYWCSGCNCPHHSCRCSVLD